MCDVNLFAPYVYQEENYLTTEARKWLADLHKKSFYSFNIVLSGDTVKILCHVTLNVVQNAAMQSFKSLICTAHISQVHFMSAWRAPPHVYVPDERVKWFLFRQQQGYKKSHIDTNIMRLEKFYIFFTLRKLY